MAKLNSTALPSSETFQTNRKGHLEALAVVNEAAACVVKASEQTMVGTGYMNESALSQLVCDAKLMEIGAGISEIRRILIGRELMGSTG